MAKRSNPPVITPVSVGYVRVSTDKQADKGFSLEAQTERIRAMAVVQGVELAEIVIDAGESAKSLDRPGMVHLLDMVNCKAISRVIVAKLDRLTRSVKDLANLLELFEKHGVALVSVAESLDTQSAAGRLVLNVMMSVAQWEREAIGERTRATLRHMKATGRVYSAVPYGFAAVDGKLVPLPDEQAVIGRIRELRATKMPLAKIAASLNALDTPTKHSGGRWFPSTIKNVLDSTLPGEGTLWQRLHSAA